MCSLWNLLECSLFSILREGFFLSKRGIFIGLVIDGIFQLLMRKMWMSEKFGLVDADE